MKSKRNTSLNPQENLIAKYVMKNLHARAAIDCWRFNLPVRKMTKEQLEEISERCHCTFMKGDKD